jgi:glycosyltransferase involved in cell wall biosynthesis
VSRHRPRPPHRNDGPVVIGWVGSSTTAPYLRLLDAPLAQLARRREVLVRVVGGAYEHPGVRVETRAYDLAREPADLESFDVGVLPEPDDEWTKGKGAFKALLYMATAVPVVASRVGVNPDVVVDGESGWCVDDDAGWVERLDELAADPSLRERLGRRGREHVERRFSIGAQAPRLAEVLQRARATPR